ncbi:MAG: nucleotidyltransferase family protein [Candidatus Thermoplasmatota archaeon]|nr:nucleotidyltransferase family protein [Candidatus Thermoplasmatota archaeon]
MAKFHGISIDKNIIASFCKKNGIRKLSLFGSILRDDFGPDSDIDVLVEFEEGRKIGYFELFDIEENLSQLYGGRKVDVRTPADLSRYFRKEVMNKAVIQYAS